MWFVTRCSHRAVDTLAGFNDAAAAPAGGPRSLCPAALGSCSRSPRSDPASPCRFCRRPAGTCHSLKVDGTLFYCLSRFIFGSHGSQSNRSIFNTKCTLNPLSYTMSIPALISKTRQRSNSESCLSRMVLVGREDMHIRLQRVLTRAGSKSIMMRYRVRVFWLLACRDQVPAQRGKVIVTYALHRALTCSCRCSRRPSLRARCPASSVI